MIFGLVKNYWKYIPNILTILRLPLAIFCCYYAMTISPMSLTISMILFVIAGTTDYLDGYLARKWQTVSSFGKFIDPIADKILILGVLFVFTYKTIIPVVFTAIIAFREILLTVIRTFLMTRKIILASNYSGKIKTFSQGIAILLIYFLLIFREDFEKWFGTNFVEYSIIILMVWSVLITMYSGAQFFLDNKRILKRLI